MNTAELTQGKRPMSVPMIGVLILCGFTFAAGSWVHYLTTPEPTPMEVAREQTPISLGDVRQVIAALNTLAMPQRYDFDPPVKVTVQGDGTVRVFLKTKREVEFKSKGTDLKSAIADLSFQAREVADLKF
jgi:hypothetical protein